MEFHRVSIMLNVNAELKNLGRCIHAYYDQLTITLNQAASEQPTIRPYSLSNTITSYLRDTRSRLSFSRLTSLPSTGFSARRGCRMQNKTRF